MPCLNFLAEIFSIICNSSAPIKMNFSKFNIMYKVHVFDFGLGMNLPVPMLLITGLDCLSEPVPGAQFL